MFFIPAVRLHCWSATRLRKFFGAMCEYLSASYGFLFRVVQDVPASLPIATCITPGTA